MRACSAVAASSAILRKRAHFGLGHELGVAAEQNVGSATGHVGGDGDGAFAPRLRDDVGFALVLFGVQDVVLDARLLEMSGKFLGFFDRDGTDENRLTLFVKLFDLIGDVLEFRRLGLEDHVGFVFTNHRAIGRNDGDVEFVNLLELGSLGVGCTGHARELVVHAEIILEGDRGESLVLVFDIDVFFGFDRLVETVGPATSRHQTAREFVDDHNFAVFHDIIDVQFEQDVSAQTLVDVVEQLDVVRVVEVRDADQLFHFVDAGFSESSRFGFFVDRVIRFFLQARAQDDDDRCGNRDQWNRPSDR